MECLSNKDTMRNKRIDEEIAELVSKLDSKISHLERTEKNINVDVLRVNVLKMVGIMAFAIATTYSIATAYNGILNGLNNVSTEISRLRTDMQENKEETNLKIITMQSHIEDKTKDRFTHKDSQLLSQALCNEMIRLTKKKVNCPYWTKQGVLETRNLQ